MASSSCPGHRMIHDRHSCHTSLYMWETQCSKTFSPLTPLPASSKGLRKACAANGMCCLQHYHDVFMMFWSRKCWQLQGLPGCAQQLNRWSYRSSRWFPASYIYVLLGSIKYSRSRPHNRSHLTTGHGFECFQTWLPKNWRVGLWLGFDNVQASYFSNDHSGKETKPNKHDAVTVWNPVFFHPMSNPSGHFRPRGDNIFQEKNHCGGPKSGSCTSWYVANPC